MKRIYIQPQTATISLHGMAPLMEGSPIKRYDDETVGITGLAREETFGLTEDW